MIKKLVISILAIIAGVYTSTMFIKVKDLVEQEEALTEYINQMSLEEEVGQLFLVTPEQVQGDSLEITDEMIDTLQRIPVGGLVFFAANIETREQIRNYIEQAQESSKIKMFIAVDEEGGIVARIGNNPYIGTTSFDSMGYVQEDKEAYNVGNTIGTEIKELGFNLDFAPVADVNSNPDNPIIGERAFSNDPVEAAHLVASCVKGFQDAHMLCTLKHFPGHGDTNTDTHLEQTILNKDQKELESCEWIPFKEGIKAGSDFVMVSHIVVPDICEDDLPSSLSYEMITNRLRKTLNYQGLVISDSFQMEAISDYYSPSEAAIQAILAGEDIVLMPEDLEEAYYGVIEAVQDGRITIHRIHQSVRKILEKKIDAGIVKLENYKGFYYTNNY